MSQTEGNLWKICILSLSLSLALCVCIYIYIYIHVCVYIYIYIYVYVYYVYVYMYMVPPHVPPLFRCFLFLSGAQHMDSALRHPGGLFAHLLRTVLLVIRALPHSPKTARLCLPTQSRNRDALRHSRKPRDDAL